MSCGTSNPAYTPIEEYNFTGQKFIGCWKSNTTCLGDDCYCDYVDDNAGLNVGGLVGVIVFYAVILLVGLFAAWQNRRMRLDADEEINAEDVILAKRNINLFVGIMTMTG